MHPDPWNPGVCNTTTKPPPAGSGQLKRVFFAPTAQAMLFGGGCTYPHTGHCAAPLATSAVAVSKGARRRIEVAASRYIHCPAAPKLGNPGMPLNCSRYGPGVPVSKVQSCPGYAISTLLLLVSGPSRNKSVVPKRMKKLAPWLGQGWGGGGGVQGPLVVTVLVTVMIETDGVSVTVEVATEHVSVDVVAPVVPGWVIVTVETSHVAVVPGKLSVKVDVGHVAVMLTVKV